jgi:hypothetical protein
MMANRLSLAMAFVAGLTVVMTNAQTPNPLHANITCNFLKDYDHM